MNASDIAKRIANLMAKKIALNANKTAVVLATASALSTTSVNQAQASTTHFNQEHNIDNVIAAVPQNIDTQTTAKFMDNIFPNHVDPVKVQAVVDSLRTWPVKDREYVFDERKANNIKMEKGAPDLSFSKDTLDIISCGDDIMGGYYVLDEGSITINKFSVNKIIARKHFLDLFDKKISDWSKNPDLKSQVSELEQNKSKWAVSCVSNLEEVAKKINSTDTEQSVKTHEIGHGIVDKETKAYSGGLSPMHTAKSVCIDEIASNLREAWRQIDLYKKNPKSHEISDKFTFLKDMLNVENLDTNSKEFHKNLLGNTSKMWSETLRESYSNQIDEKVRTILEGSKAVLFDDTLGDYTELRSDILHKSGMIRKDAVKEYYEKNPDVQLEQSTVKSIDKMTEDNSFGLDAKLIGQLDLNVLKKAVNETNPQKYNAIFDKLIKTAKAPEAPEAVSSVADKEVNVVDPVQEADAYIGQIRAINKAYPVKEQESSKKPTSLQSLRGIGTNPRSSVVKSTPTQQMQQPALKKLNVR